MADQPAQREQEQPAASEQSGKKSGSSALLSRVLSRRWLVALLLISLVGHLIGFACLRLRGNHADGELTPEVSLGQFRFEADPAEQGQIASAEFSLHVALLAPVAEAGRRELRAKRFRVQEAVEELIRRAHSGDFDDPLLSEFKQQLQEQINQALGIRAVAEVIVTDLKLQHSQALGATAGMTETAETQPWTSNSPG